MAFQFDGDGYIAIPQWGSGGGDFKVTGSFNYATSAFQAMLGDVSGSTFILYTDTSNTVKLKISSTVTVTGLVAGTSYPFTIERVGSIITFTCNGQTPTISFGGTNVPWSQFGGFGSSQSSKYTGLLEGEWEFTDDIGAIRTYEFNQPIGTGNLPETTGGFDGTLTGFTTGDYDGAGADSITISSVSNGDFFNRDNKLNQKVITISGANIGELPSSVEYSLDYGEWTVLDALPAANYSGTVTVKNKQFLQVRGVGSNTSSAVITLTVGLSVVAGWQSNEQGYGISTQPVNRGASSLTPLMYNGTDIVTLIDPTATVAGGGGSGGSTWPRIAKQYADEGTIVCLYNIAKGGSLISEWQKGGVNYDKIAPFVALVGGLGLFTTIGGENDAQNGITQASMETQLSQLCADINADFSADSYICKFPMKAPAGNVATVFAAYDAVVEANVFAKAGGDLSIIDIEVATATGNDGVHLKQDADLTTAANIRYTAQQAGINGSSTLNLTVTGISNGSFITVLNNESGINLSNAAETYTSESLSKVLSVPVGTRIKGYVDDASNPSVNGAYLEGVTV